ncbi:MAG: MaoC family dehydratase [SAR202 cluster bacterium]|nr:MaoC family dehydratase [SAR202 cluster bacterium]
MTTTQRSAEQVLAEARKLIGRETKPVRARYPVELDPIRRFCHMSGDNNPLFLDPEHARKSRFGAVIAPMTAVALFGGGGVWPPPSEAEEQLPPVPTLGDRAINLGTEWEFLKPVRVGDHLSVSRRIADVFIKPIRLDAKAFWTVTETIYRNQHGEVVTIMRNTGLRHRTPEEVRTAGDA